MKAIIPLMILTLPVLIASGCSDNQHTQQPQNQPSIDAPSSGISDQSQQEKAIEPRSPQSINSDNHVAEITEDSIYKGKELGAVTAEKSKQAYESAKDKGTELGQNIKDESKELWNKTKEIAKDTVDKSKELGASAVKKSKEIYEQAKEKSKQLYDETIKRHDENRPTKERAI